jgi:hypothetical protein
VTERIERELRGLDAERPLPPELYRRLEAALLDEDAGLFDALDAPRPIPPATRAALEQALTERSGKSDRRGRVLLGAAAAVLLVVGAVAAVRTGVSSTNRQVAVGSRSTVPQANVPSVLQAPSTAAPRAVAAGGAAAATPTPTTRRSTTTTTWNCGFCARNGDTQSAASGAAAGAAGGGQPGVPAAAAARLPAQVSSVDPSSGPRRGGTIVTLTGSGFTGASGVLFGSLSAVNFTVVSDTEIRVMTPASPNAQRVTISVTYADGWKTPTSDSGPFFTYT